MSVSVIGAALASGVREWVVCAGARNIPLLEALMALPENQRGKVWNFFEDRSAAFFALGRAKALGLRVAVITTSGTAAAELLPATIEAYYSGYPLLLITADRPPEFRGSGAPQAIEQAALLTPYVWRMLDWTDDESAAESLAGDDPIPRQPEHWNVCFDEPLAGDAPAVWEWSIEEDGRAAGELIPVIRGATAEEIGRVEEFCRHEGNDDQLLVLLGELSKAEQSHVEPLLEQMGAPIWAEGASGLRESPALRSLMLTGGEREISSVSPTRVLRLGGVPGLRFWRDLEKLPEVEVLSLARTGFSGLGRNSQVISTVDALRPGVFRECDGREIDATFAEDLQEALAKFPGCEVAIFRKLSLKIPEQDLVFLGNSLPVREWNMGASFDVRHRCCHASRGANGIDGQVSTFLGLAAGFGEGEVGDSSSWGIFGDLTTMYDLSAPWVLPQMSAGGKLRVVVINNGGGRIFDQLPAVREGNREQAELIRNRHTHSFEHWAAMWGMAYVCWRGSADDSRWQQPVGDRVVIEIVPDEDQTQEWRTWWEAREKE